jgi:hypothetical protein
MAQGKKYIVNDKDNRIMYEMVLKGYNLMQILEKIGITYPTYKVNIENFLNIIKEANEYKELRDLQETKNALRKKIEGYEVEETIYKTKVVDGETIEYLAERKVKQILPDTMAIIFDLVNKSNGEFVSINREPKKEIDLEVIQTIKELLTTPV